MSRLPIAPLVPLVLAVTLLTGCATNPANGGAPQQVSYATVISARFVQVSANDTASGAVIGGVLGAGIGALLHNTDGALAGGAIGALGGGAVGSAQTQTDEEITVQTQAGQTLALTLHLQPGQPPYQIGQPVEIMSGGGRTEVTPVGP